MKTLIIIFTIGFLPCALIAQSEDGIETGPSTEEKIELAHSGSAGDVSDASMAFHVVPPSYATVTGTATFTGPLANTQRTYQLLVHDTLLTALRGRRLTALSWRLPSSATSAWPTADLTYPNYDVYLSGSAPPANRSLTFALNVVGVQTQVRSTSLTITTDSYTFGGSPNAWGPEITFTPWLYAGGHLLIEIRQSGFTGTSRSVDAIGTSIPGYGTDFSACWTGNYAGTTGSQGNFSVVRLTADSLAVSVGEGDLRTPEAFALLQNYPNPFNPTTNIEFRIPESGVVTLRVFDLLGREMITLVEQNLDPGTHTVSWNATGSPSGVYFYRMQSGSFSQTRKLILMR